MDKERTRVFISQAMNGRSREEIEKEREALAVAAEYLIGDEIDVIDSYDPEYKGKKPLEMLGEAIKKMAEADYVVFGPGAKTSRGCKIEFSCAKAYGINIITIGVA